MSISSMNIRAMSSFSNPDISNELEHVVKSIMNTESAHLQPHPAMSFRIDSPEPSPGFTESPESQLPPPLPLAPQQRAPASTSPLPDDGEEMRKLLDQIELHRHNAFTKI
jgi:hypothetical protein